MSKHKSNYFNTITNKNNHTLLRWTSIISLSLLLFPELSFGQIKDTVKAKKTHFEYTLFKNPDIKMKLGAVIQTWGQYTEWNPGSQNESGDIKNSDFGLAIRRLRLTNSFTLGKKLKLNFAIGENNFNAKGKTFPYLKILDLYATYNISKPFAIAFGKTTYDGLSRYTAPSTSTMMQTDLPLIAQPTLNYTDDLTRDLALILLGDIGKLNYRVVFIQPYSFSYTGANPSTPEEGVSQFTDEFKNIQYSTYFKYDFLEKENSRGPNFTGTYLGKYKLFSIGIGTKYQKDALYSMENDTKSYHDMSLWAADLYWDHPVTSTFVAAITAYLSYFNYNLGPNYLRNVGVNNPSYGLDGTSGILNGSGNSFPSMGTGQSIYGQFGILFKKMGKQTDWGQLEPYVVMQSSNFDALKSNMLIGNLGINWYLNGQNSKLSLDVQNRPVFSNTTLKELDRKYMIVLQYQYKLH